MFDEKIPAHFVQYAADKNADEEPVLLHPNMAMYYREQVSQLCQALTAEDYRTEAAALIHNLIEKIVLNLRGASLPAHQSSIQIFVDRCRQYWWDVLNSYTLFVPMRNDQATRNT